MAIEDTGDLAGSIEGTRTGKPVRELHPVTFDRPTFRGTKDFRPRPVTDESPTSPPVETPEVPFATVTTPEGDTLTMATPEATELHPVTPHPSILPPD